MAIARAPAAWAWRTISTTLMVSSSQPIRVLTMTGTLTASTVAATAS